MAVNQPTSSLLPVLCRLFWMMLGPMALVLLTFNIANVGNGWITAPDLAFFAVLGGVVLARWLEFWGGNPLTATGEPATPTDLRRFVVAALPLGLGVWVLANLIGNHWLAR